MGRYGEQHGRLKAFHDAAIGASDTLGSAAEFDRLTGMAPTPLHNLFFMDVAGVTAMVENALADEARDAYSRNVEGVRRILERLHVRRLDRRR